MYGGYSGYGGYGGFKDPMYDLVRENARMRSAILRGKSMKSAPKKKKAAPKKKKRAASGTASRTTARKKPSAVGSLMRGIGGLAGRYFGGSGGAELGSKAAGWFADILGVGDYRVNSNSIIRGTDPPLFNKNGRGTIIRHREYITDINSSIAFEYKTFSINPGLGGSFPWLHQIASNFEEYCIRGMVFEFKSNSADALNSTNTALGTVIMATQYNTLNPPFTDKQTMENYEFCTSAKPSQSFVHPIECAVGENPLHVMYVRTGETTIGDKRLYDLGTFQISTVGMQAASVIGELWVTYDVEFLKPRLSPVNEEYHDHWVAGSPSTEVKAAHFMGLAPTLTSDSSFGTFVPSDGSSILIPDSNVDYYFQVRYTCQGDQTTLTTPLSWTIGNNIQQVSVDINSTTSVIRQNAGVTLANWQFIIMTLKFVATANSYVEANRTILIGTTGTFPANVVGADLWVTSLNFPVTSLASVKKAPDVKLPAILTYTTEVKAMKDEVKTESKEEKKDDDEVEDDDEDDFKETDEYKDFLAFKRMKSKGYIPDSDFIKLEEPPSVKSLSRK